MDVVNNTDILTTCLLYIKSLCGTHHHVFIAPKAVPTERMRAQAHSDKCVSRKEKRQKTNTTHKFRAKMDLTPPITIFSLSVGSVRFSCKMLSESVQLHPPNSDPSGRWLHKKSRRLSTPRKWADMPPIKVLEGQMRVKGRLKGVILWVHVPNWKTKSSCGRTQRNSHRLSPKWLLLLCACVCVCVCVREADSRCLLRHELLLNYKMAQPM